MPNIVEINDAAGLAEHRLAWNALLDETPRASFFHTPDWYETLLRHFGDQLSPRVLVARAAGRTIGIVPLVVKRERRRVGTVRVLTYPLDGWGCWCSPIGGDQAATLRLAMRRLAETPRDWDLIDLPGVDCDGADHGRTEKAMRAAGLAASPLADASAPVINCDGDWEGYLAGRCSKTRQEVRRLWRRVQELGDVEYVRRRPAPLREGDGAAAWDLYDECEEVARGSWQARSSDGNTLCHDRFRPFFRDAHAAAARLGMVDLNLLRVDGRAVAYNYNYHYYGAVYGLRMGYREDCPLKGVGAALLMRSVEDSFFRGDLRYELGVGDYAYKRRFATAIEATYRLTHTPIGSWRGQAVRLSRWLRASRSVGKSAAT